MNQNLKKLGCLFFAVLLLVLYSPIAAANLTAKNTGGRRIAIVLDNSDSMIINGSKESYSSRWAEATYALRTFLYMVEDTDVVKLFTVAASTDTMDEDINQKIATVSDGSIDKTNVDKVLQQVGISYQTKTYGMDAAYSWVAKSGDANTEKWVVILSDGDFYPPDSNSDKDRLSYSQSVGDRAYKWSLHNIHTIFVGLDLAEDKEKELENLQRKYLSVYHARKNQRSIEETILGISEKIYSMKELDDAKIRKCTEFTCDPDSGTLTWETDPDLSAYLEQVIVIAQTSIKPEEEPEIPTDLNIQIIQSDRTFSWCSKNDLADVLDKHDKAAKPSFDFGDPKDFEKKIAETFLGKYCYIRSYSQSEIGNQLKFQVPKGDYTYRIYYELKDSVHPELIMKRDGAVVQPDTPGVYSVTEGPLQVDFELRSGETAIPKTLEAIRYGLEAVSMSGAESTGKINLGYKDTKDEDNRYQFSVSFNGKAAEAAVKISPDLQRYQFQIPEGQIVNIDQPDGNLLTIETTLPLNWLRDHLAGNLAITLNPKDTATFTFAVDDYKVVSGEGGPLKISVPIHYINSQSSLSPNVPFKAAFSINGDTIHPLEAEGTLTVALGPTEIDLRVPEPSPNLTSLSAKIPVLNMTARAGDEDVTEDTILKNVAVTGFGTLEEVSFKYNENTKSIEYAGKFRDTFQILTSGKNSGTVRVVGEAYRKGILVDGHLEMTKQVTWTGTVWELIRGLIFKGILLAAAITILILTYTGKLLFQEGIDYFAFNFLNWDLPLIWDVNGPRGPGVHQLTVGKGFRWYPWKIKVAFHITDDPKLQNSTERITLRGTRKGYCLVWNSKEMEILDRLNITFMSKDCELEKENQKLEFRYINDKRQTYDMRMRYQRERGRYPATICVFFLILLVWAAMRNLI